MAKSSRSPGSAQQGLFPVEHRGLQPRRLKASGRYVNREAFYAMAWRRHNKRIAHINHGYSALEWILTPDGAQYPPPVSQRDAEVAASVIQWLGTNSGEAFLHDVVGAIADAKEQQADKRLARIKRQLPVAARPGFRNIQDLRRTVAETRRRLAESADEGGQR